MGGCGESEGCSSYCSFSLVFPPPSPQDNICRQHQMSTICQVCSENYQHEYDPGLAIKSSLSWWKQLTVVQSRLEWATHRASWCGKFQKYTKVEKAWWIPVTSPPSFIISSRLFHLYPHLLPYSHLQIIEAHPRWHRISAVKIQHISKKWGHILEAYNYSAFIPRKIIDSKSLILTPYSQLNCIL